MCTFNGARFLREQLASIASQQQPPDEMVICDDKSTDGTADLLHEFASSCPLRIRIIQNVETLGYKRNFEQAIELCQGDIIALADQDDIWKPGKTEAVVRIMQEHPSASYMFSDGDVVDDNGSLLGGTLWPRIGFKGSLQDRFGKGDQLRILLRRNVVTGAAMAFRKSLKAIALPIGKDWIHDHWIATVGSCISHGLAAPQRLFQYRRHESQQIGVSRATFIAEYRDALTSTANTFEEKLSLLAELDRRVQDASRQDESFRHNLTVIADKQAHLTKRAQLYSAGLFRAGAVLSEAITGRYSTFSNSWQSILHDLCPPSLVGILRSWSTH